MNEPAIGRVFRRWLDTGRVKREDLFVVTKLPKTGNRASDVEAMLTSSLTSLQLDYVDMYLVHTPFGLLPSDDGDIQRHADGSVVLDMETNHAETWKVSYIISRECLYNELQYIVS